MNVAVIFYCCNSRTCMWLLYFVVAILERACGFYILLLQYKNVHVDVLFVVTITRSVFGCSFCCYNNMKCMCVFYFAVVIVQSVHERSIMLLQWQEMYNMHRFYVLVNSCG